MKTYANCSPGNSPINQILYRSRG